MRKHALIAALVFGCLHGSPCARAAAEQNSAPAQRVHSVSDRKCPSRSELDSMLGKASALMEQTHYQDASDLLQPLSDLNCDAHVSLLLAAALEARGDAQEATEVLQRAHTTWPSNNSVAASLAREYLAAKQVDKAANALAHFHASAETPEQEMEMAVVVYLAAHQLVPAQAVAETAYKYDPSVHTLLLLANALQLQGRYPNVIKLLENKRGVYTDSPEFFVTLAESEFDASIYPAAREDLQHAIALDAKSYQAHYILGNVLFKLSNTEGAIAEYRQAIDLAPGQPRTYFQLALVLRSKEDESGEKQVLEQALTADDHYAPAQCELGRILLEEHRAADAVSHLNTAIQFNPRSEEAYFLLAKAYAGLGEKDKSAEMVKRLEIVRKENRPGPEDRNGSDPAANQTPNP